MSLSAKLIIRVTPEIIYGKYGDARAFLGEQENSGSAPFFCDGDQSDFQQGPVGNTECAKKSRNIHTWKITGQNEHLI